MMDLFFYGTLRHLPLLRIVLDRPIDASDLEPARLCDHAVRAVHEGPFPTLLREQGRVADGLLVRNLSDTDIARLDHYEGGFNHDLVEMPLESGEQARVFVSPQDAWTPGALWDLDAWIAMWGEMSCHAASEVMGYLGRLSRDNIEARFPQIRARAWSRTLAGKGPGRQGTFNGNVRLDRHERVYSGFFALDEATLRHDTFAGGQSAALERSWLVGADASLVLPYDAVRDRVLLVEQMRVGPLGRGDREIWQYEPIAGRIDPGETPQDAAHREAQEEAGLTFDRLETVGASYASPGTTTDFFHIFVGLADLPDDVTGLGGLSAEHEDIRSCVMSFDDFLGMAEAGTIVNTPLVLLAYWLAHHRSRLRS